MHDRPRRILRLPRSARASRAGARRVFRGLLATALEPDELLADGGLPQGRPRRTGHGFAEGGNRATATSRWAGACAVLSLDTASRIRDAGSVIFARLVPRPSRAAAGLIGERGPASAEAARRGRRDQHARRPARDARVPAPRRGRLAARALGRAAARERRRRDRGAAFDHHAVTAIVNSMGAGDPAPALPGRPAARRWGLTGPRASAASTARAGRAPCCSTSSTRACLVFAVRQRLRVKHPSRA